MQAKKNIGQQFGTFVVAGVVTTVLQYATLILLVEFAILEPVPASVVGALAGALLSYFLNRTFTFQSRAQHHRAMPKFFTVAAIAILSNTALMYIFVEVIGIPYIPAQIATTGAIIPITFGLNRLWSFAEN